MNVRQWEEKWLETRFGTIPAVCPVCGAETVRLIWHPGHYYGGPIKSSIDAGMTILAGDQQPPHAPGWTCLVCKPRWLTVQQLTFEVEDLQIKKEDAVAEMDFESAKRYQSLQEGVWSRQRELLSTLV